MKVDLKVAGGTKSTCDPASRGGGLGPARPVGETFPYPWAGARSSGPIFRNIPEGNIPGPDLQGQGWTPAVSRPAEYLKGSSAHCSDQTQSLNTGIALCLRVLTFVLTPDQPRAVTATGYRAGSLNCFNNCHTKVHGPSVNYFGPIACGCLAHPSRAPPILANPRPHRRQSQTPGERGSTRSLGYDPVLFSQRVPTVARQSHRAQRTRSL